MRFKIRHSHLRLPQLMDRTAMTWRRHCRNTQCGLYAQLFALRLLAREDSLLRKRSLVRRLRQRLWKYNYLRPHCVSGTSFSPPHNSGTHIARTVIRCLAYCLTPLSRRKASVSWARKIWASNWDQLVGPTYSDPTRPRSGRAVVAFLRSPSSSSLDSRSNSGVRRCHASSQIEALP